MLGVADAAGHPGVVLSDSYVTLCESIGHMSPKSESLKISINTSPLGVKC